MQLYTAYFYFYIGLKHFYIGLKHLVQATFPFAVKTSPQCLHHSVSEQTLNYSWGIKLSKL